MSHPFSPAVLTRITEFADEIHSIAQGALSVRKYVNTYMDQAIMDEVCEILSGLPDLLLEALRDIEDETLTLPAPAPYVLLLALDRVIQLRRDTRLLICASVDMPQDLGLAAGHVAGRLRYLSDTAAHIRDTVLEEFPKPPAPACPQPCARS